MFDSFGSFGTNNSGPGPTDVLINNSTEVLGHWTATDLNTGTSHTGPNWTTNGTIALNAADGSFPKRVSVGVFSDANYFSLAHPSIFEQATFSMAIVVSGADFGNSPALIELGNTVTGWELQTNGNALATANASTAASGTSLATNTPGVMFMGFDDATGTVYGQINNGSVGATVVGASIVYAGAATTLGRFIPYGGFAFDGVVYEVWLSSQTPSHTLFNSIYAEVLANGS